MWSCSMRIQFLVFAQINSHTKIAVHFIKNRARLNCYFEIILDWDDIIFLFLSPSQILSPFPKQVSLYLFDPFASFLFFSVAANRAEISIKYACINVQYSLFLPNKRCRKQQQIANLARTLEE